MNLDMLSRSAAPNQAEALSAALESVDRSIVETRTLSCLLHPSLLDEIGLRPQPAGSLMNSQDGAESKSNSTYRPALIDSQNQQRLRCSASCKRAARMSTDIPAALQLKSV